MRTTSAVASPLTNLFPSQQLHSNWPRWTVKKGQYCRLDLVPGLGCSNTTWTDCVVAGLLDGEGGTWFRTKTMSKDIIVWRYIKIKLAEVAAEENCSLVEVLLLNDLHCNWLPQQVLREYNRSSLIYHSCARLITISICVKTAQQFVEFKWGQFCR